MVNMATENQILQLLLTEKSLTAREITDRLYGKKQHQSIVFGRLQKMQVKGIIRKDVSSWPYRWALASDATLMNAVTTISTKIPPVMNNAPIPTNNMKTITHDPIKRKTVALISCTGSKRGKEGYSCKARFLYDTSPFFPLSLAYAEIIADDIYVLSAEYHLVELNRVIKWYNKTLNDFSTAEAATWGNIVVHQLSEKYDFSETDFVILAGKNYYNPIVKSFPHPPKLPLKHANGFKKQKHERDALYMCARLHKLFNGLPRFHWDSIDKINFDNGVYIVFEDGESYYGMDRIVRVGTHRSDGRLRNRLKDHFIKANNDGSIFRKNIGRAILNKTNNPYLSVWTKSSSYSDIRYDDVFQEKLEKHVTE